METNLRRLRELSDKLVSATKDLETFWRESPDMLVISDADGYYKRVSPASEKLLGWEPDELIGHHFSEFVHPDFIDPTATTLQSLKDSDLTYEFENRFRTKDGNYARVLWKASRTVDSQNYAVARVVPDE